MFAFIPKVTGLQGSPSLGPTGLPLGVALLAAPGGSSWDIWGALPQGCSSSWLRGRGGGLGGRAEDRALGPWAVWARLSPVAAAALRQGAV